MEKTQKFSNDKNRSHLLPHLILCGMPLSGKSTIAPLLINALPQYSKWIDLDDRIQENLGTTISSHLKPLNLPKNQKNNVTDDFPSRLTQFRVIESRLLSNLLKTPSPLVLSLGGGTLTTKINFQMVLDHILIYLHCTTDQLLERLTFEELQKRPLLTQDPINWLQSNAFLRSLQFNQSHLKVNAGQSPLQVVNDIIQGLCCLLPNLKSKINS